MRKALLIVSVAVFGLSFGCGGKDAKDKPATAAVAPDTVVAVADMTAVAPDTVAAVPDTTAFAPDTVAAVPDTTAFAPDTDTTFTDHRNGRVYRIVKINGQVWMAENLNYAAEGSKCYGEEGGEVTSYENGSPIRTTLSNAEVQTNCKKYGRLYNWKTALNACPAGFHLPSDMEWRKLEDYVGGWEMAGTKLKSSIGWKRFKDVPVGTDEYGFLALPGGFGNFDDGFQNAGANGYWWSTTEDDVWSKDRYALSRYIFYDEESAFRAVNDKTYLFSVRCVADWSD
jgi:uncharacterized protein (TIGR02145 family)